MSLPHMNGERPLVVVELRRARSRWREPDSVLRAAVLVVVACALGIAAVLLVTGQRPPWPLYAVQWAAVGVSVLVWPLGRPCARCGRWTRHGLLCPRWRA